MFVEIAALVKGVTGAIGAAKAAGTVWAWLKGPGDDALRVAFRRTVGKYGQTFPAIESQLAEFLESDRVRQRLQAATSEGVVADAVELAALLVEAGDFYLPDGKEGMLVARDVVAFFLKAFDKEQLKGGNALVYAEAKRQADTQKILSAVSSQGAEVKGMLEQLLGAVTGPQLEQRVRTQKEYLKAKPPAEARAAWRAFEHELRAAGQWSPNVAWQVYTEIAVCSWQMGENDAAADEFENAYAAKPDEELPSLNRALAFLIRGRVDAALAAADGVLAKSPDNHRALSVKAQILHWVDRDEDAVEVLQRAVDGTGATGDELRLYAIACVKLKRYDAAVEAGRRAVALNQARVQARNILGIALLSWAQHEIERSGADGSVTAHLEEAERMFVEAAEMARGELRTHDLSVALLNRANAVLALGRTEEAAELARQGWLASPHDAQASLAYGRMALAADKPQQALAAVERLVGEGNVEARITAFLSFLTSAPRKYEDVAEEAERLFPTKAALPTIVFQTLLDRSLAEKRIDVAKEIEAAWNAGAPAERSLARARIAAALGDVAGANAGLEAADSELKQSKDRMALFRLAFAAHEK
jgi:Flp pilus assembly protein TadD